MLCQQETQKFIPPLIN